MAFTETLIAFLNQNAGALSTLFSGVVMLATVFYAILTATLVKETRRMRESQTEPRIQVTACPREEFVSIISLHVKNIGLGPAYDVRFKLRAESENKGAGELIQDFSRSQFLKKGLQYLGPGQGLQSGFTDMTKNFEGKIKARLIIEVAYNGAFGKAYKDSIPVYFDEFEGFGTLGTPHLYSIAKSLEKMEQNINHLTSGFRRLSVDIYSDNDRRKEAADADRFRREALQRDNPTDS